MHLVLTAMCPAPQCLLILTTLVVAAAFVALDVKWAEQWQSARISLQVRAEAEPFLCPKGSPYGKGRLASGHGGGDPLASPPCG